MNHLSSTLLPSLSPAGRGRTRVPVPFLMRVDFLVQVRRKPRLCTVLLTAKGETSALHKALSSRLEGQLAMAEVRGAAGGAGLARALGVSTFPALVMIVPASARRAD